MGLYRVHGALLGPGLFVLVGAEGPLIPCRDVVDVRRNGRSFGEDFGAIVVGGPIGHVPMTPTSRCCRVVGRECVLTALVTGVKVRS